MVLEWHKLLGVLEKKISKGVGNNIFFVTAVISLLNFAGYIFILQVSNV